MILKFIIVQKIKTCKWRNKRIKSIWLRILQMNLQKDINKDLKHRRFNQTIDLDFEWFL